jgi:succinate dehydrogenase hydrophobic anchor subunit
VCVLPQASAVTAVLVVVVSVVLVYIMMCNVHVAKNALIDSTRSSTFTIKLLPSAVVLPTASVHMQCSIYWDSYCLASLVSTHQVAQAAAVL